MTTPLSHNDAHDFTNEPRDLEGNQLRALALKNANAIFKPFLTFYGSKCAASKDAKHRNCKKFYNSATVQFIL